MGPGHRHFPVVNRKVEPCSKGGLNVPNRGFWRHLGRGEKMNLFHLPLWGDDESCRDHSVEGAEEVLRFFHGPVLGRALGLVGAQMASLVLISGQENLVRSEKRAAGENDLLRAVVPEKRWVFNPPAYPPPQNAGHGLRREPNPDVGLELSGIRGAVTTFVPLVWLG